MSLFKTGVHPETFYDNMTQDPLIWRRKRGSKHEFGADIERVTPNAEEIRLLGNRHRDCKYYQIGVDICHM